MPEKKPAQKLLKGEVRKRAGAKLAWLLVLVVAMVGAFFLTRQHLGNPGIGSPAKPEKQCLGRVMGPDPLRQFLTETSGGRSQALEAAFDPARREWFNVYGQEDRQPGEWGHWTGRGMNWNDMCAGCHNTRVRKNYDV